METIQVKTGSRIHFADITSRVQEVISKSGVKEGIAVVSRSSHYGRTHYQRGCGSRGGSGHNRETLPAGSDSQFLSARRGEFRRSHKGHSRGKFRAFDRFGRICGFRNMAGDIPLRV